MNPSDPSIPYIECEAEGIFANGSRARTQAYFATEQGLDFRDVRCLRIYGRRFTRQYVWDSEGRQHWADEKNHETKVGWYFARTLLVENLPALYKDSVYPMDAIAPMKTRYLPEGWYSDTDGVTPARGYTANDAPAEPPPEWEPETWMHCWLYCDRDHPDAIPLWECTQW